MKVPNVKFGNDPRTSQTQNQNQFVQKRSDTSPATRRGDISNPNRILTVGFGFGAEKGTNEDHLAHRNSGYYNRNYVPQKGALHPREAKNINTSRGNYTLANKFEYGYDNKGGISARNIPVRKEDLTKCLDESFLTKAIKTDNKEKIERQNFTIQHDKQL